MRIPVDAISVDIDVPFHHCDPLGVVWHGRYFEYFEQARGALMRSINLDVEQVAGFGYRLFVVDCRCRFLRPIAYGDSVRCVAFFLKPSPHLRIAFHLNRGELRMARAIMVFATTTADGQLVPEVPSVFIDRIRDVG